MLDIWFRLPCDMRPMMRHVVGALTLIWSLQDGDRPMSSSNNEVPNVAPLHDYLPSHGSGG